jgi:hypothetical protein
MASEHNTRVMLCTTTGHQAYCRRSAGPSHGRRRGDARAAGRRAQHGGRTDARTHGRTR